MVIVALLAGVAVWVWTGPDAAAVRLAGLVPGGRKFRVTSLVLRPSRSRRAEAWRRASIELCQALSAELAAGRTPGEAMARAVGAVGFPDPASPRPLLAAARDGGDVSAALLALAPGSGGEGLRRLASCWNVSVTAGAGLAALVERVATTLRHAESHRQDVAAQLAGPRATARMLAILPALGLLMGAGLGMRPLGFLFGSLPGLACLVAGTALDACGLWWTQRMTTRALRDVTP